MNATAVRRSIFTTSTLPSSETTTSAPVPSATNTSRAQSTIADKGVIAGSVVGGIALVSICLAILLYPIWQRHRAHQPSSSTAKRTSSHLPKSCHSPFPRRPSDDLDRRPAARPMTPSPRRLAIDATAPSSAVQHPTGGTVPMRWDVQKASVHTPSGHPAIVWRGNIFGHDGTAAEPSAGEPPPISTSFAAEMSSLLESISIKSSYSSLRSSGAVLGVPARLQTPLSVQKLRQDSGATTVGATRGSVSDGGEVGPDSFPRVPSPSSPEDIRSRFEKVCHEGVLGVDAQDVMVGIRAGSDCEKL